MIQERKEVTEVKVSLETQIKEVEDKALEVVRKVMSDLGYDSSNPNDVSKVGYSVDDSRDHNGNPSKTYRFSNLHGVVKYNGGIKIFSYSSKVNGTEAIMEYNSILSDIKTYKQTLLENDVDLEFKNN